MVIEETEDYVTLGVPMFIGGPGSSVKGLLNWLRPLIKPAMAFILALGGVITSWKIVDVIEQREENAQQDQRTELGEYLLDQGYTPEEVQQILRAIFGNGGDGWTRYIIPIALIGAGAYILGEVLKR